MRIDGFGVVLSDLQMPLRLDVTGRGSSFDVRIQGLESSSLIDFVQTGSAAAGEQKSFTVSTIPMTMPPSLVFALGLNNFVFAQKLDANGQSASAYFLTQASPVEFGRSCSMPRAMFARRIP